jgi:hypothetical protein
MRLGRPPRCAGSPVRHIAPSVRATVTNGFVMPGTSIQVPTGINGGGVYLNGNATISGSTISGNSSRTEAPGILFLGWHPERHEHDVLWEWEWVVEFRCRRNVHPDVCGPGKTVIAHSMFSRDAGRAGSLFGSMDLPEPGRFEVRNSILADTAGPNCADPVLSNMAISDGGFNLESGTSCGFTAAGSQSDVDPMLGPLQDNGGSTLTHALLAGSLAIDAGAGTDVQKSPVTTDQRGIARPQGPASDIGAYELQQAAVVFTGFFAPLANAPTANFAKAGQAIPVRFSLGGDFGLNGSRRLSGVAAGRMHALVQHEHDYRHRVGRKHRPHL